MRFSFILRNYLSYSHRPSALFSYGRRATSRLSLARCQAWFPVRLAPGWTSRCHAPGTLFQGLRPLPSSAYFLSSWPWSLVLAIDLKFLGALMAHHYHWTTVYGHFVALCCCLRLYARDGQHPFSYRCRKSATLKLNSKEARRMDYDSTQPQRLHRAKVTSLTMTFFSSLKIRTTWVWPRLCHFRAALQTTLLAL